MRSLLALGGLAAAQTTFENQPALTLANDKIELTVTLLGGSFAAETVNSRQRTQQ